LSRKHTYNFLARLTISFDVCSNKVCHKRLLDAQYQHSCFYHKIIRYQACEMLNLNDSEFCSTAYEYQ
jgi:hypothetical protein